MAHNDDFEASSPLSSVPEDLRSPSPLKHDASADSATDDTQSSKGSSQEDSQEDEQIEDWDEDIFSQAPPESTEATTDQAAFAPQSSTQGFAQADIDAAIAASLSHNLTTVPAKRARDTDDHAGDLNPTASKSPKVLSGAAKAAATRRKAMMCTSERSPLAQINLTKLLRLPEAWRALTYAQQQDLAGMLPNQPSIGGTGAHDSKNVLFDALMSNDSLRTDVREWHEGLQSGMEDPEWREEAAEAMEKRARGELGSGKWWELVEESHEDGDGTTNGVVEAWWKDPNLLSA